MGQRLLLFISIILLFAFNANAETDANLPALPTDTAVKVVDQKEIEEISLWQKMLNFFGFGDKEETDKKPIEQEESTESQIDKVPENNIAQHIEKEQNITVNMPESDDNRLQVQDLDSADAKNTLENNSDNTNENLDGKFNMNESGDTGALSIPKGFEDDGPIKLPEIPEETMDEVTSENKEEKLNLKDGIDKIINSADKRLPEIPEAAVDDNADISKKADQMVSETESTNDLKLPDGFDDVKAEDTEVPSIPKPEIPNNTESEQKLEESMGNKAKDAQSEDFPLPQLPASTDNSDALKDIPSDSVSEPSLPVMDNPSPASAEESGATENNDPGNMQEFQNDIKLPASDNAESELEAAQDKSSENKNESEADKISDISLPAPDYASSQNTEPKKQESNIEKFTRIFTNKKSKQIELPKITEEDYASNDNTSVNRSAAELDSTQLQFVNNEAQVLILPNDDVVLGELTEQAKIDEMDLYLYIKKFWNNYNRLKREPQREVIERFIEEYDENFNQEDLS